MLQRLGDHIQNCLRRAENAERRAKQEADPALRDEYLEMAARWMQLARSYEFSASLECFLLNLERAKAERAKDPLPPRPLQ
ncbi:MAG TPA: hypothetical protein VKD43_00125 [Xanthobacteraceae bacterium]|nr:hypothetical protein [Xanthobacteraceae bacterium]